MGRNCNELISAPYTHPIQSSQQNPRSPTSTAQWNQSMIDFNSRTIWAPDFCLNLDVATGGDSSRCQNYVHPYTEEICKPHTSQDGAICMSGDILCEGLKTCQMWARKPVAPMLAVPNAYMCEDLPPGTNCNDYYTSTTRYGYKCIRNPAQHPACITNYTTSEADYCEEMCVNPDSESGNPPNFRALNDGCIHNSNCPMCVWGTKDGKCNWDQSEAVCGYDLGSNPCAFVDRVPVMVNNTFQGCSTVANSPDCTGYYQFNSGSRESQPCIQDPVAGTCSAAVTGGVCYDRCLSNTNHFRQLCNGSSSTAECLQRMGEDTLGRNYCTQDQRNVLANNFIPPHSGH